MSEVVIALGAADRAAPAAIEALKAFLRIPSVSAQPVHDADCRRAAGWLAERFKALGFDVRLAETPGHPLLIARHGGVGGPGLPRVLFYGHYDVQPPEPLELWTSPPFEPAIVDGPHGPRIVARGAVDDKGQVVAFLQACVAWHEIAGGPPVPVTVLIEGEEEVGSPNLDAAIEQCRDDLVADVVLICDTDMWDIDTPAITTRLRGMLYIEVTVRGASHDLHSGLYGGAAFNPLNALTRALGALHDADGRVQVPGFYDHVRPVAPELSQQWAALGFDEAAFLGGVGLTVPSGERGLPALERLWARPTADINGLWGGYAGVGTKTVIAAQAGAKVSFRLVPDQDPDAILAGWRQFLSERLPDRAQIAVFGASPAVVVETGSPYVRAAATALEAEFGRAPVFMGSGGSIPVVGSLKRLLGLDTLLVGFGLDDDQPHGPNEKFELRCFHAGTRALVRLLGRLGDIA